MDYNNFKSCDIISTWDNSLISKLIRLITKSKVSHTAIMYDNKFIIESSFFGVRIVHIDNFKSRCNFYVSRIRYGLNEDETVKIISYLQSKYKYKYDFLQLFTIGLHKLFGIKILNNHQKYICSELIWEAYNYADIEIVPQVDESDDVIPSDILESINLIVVEKYQI